MADTCTDSQDIICEGINGLKSLVTPFLPGIGPPTPTMTTVPAASDTIFTIPPGLVSLTTGVPPQVPQLSTTTEISTSTSVVVGGISVSQPFITDLPTAFTSIPNVLPSSTNSNGVQSPAATASVSAEQTAVPPVVAQAQSFPTGLVVGLSVTVAVLVGTGVALWYFCLRKRSRSRPVSDDSGEGASVTEIYRPSRKYRDTAQSEQMDSTDGAGQFDVVYDLPIQEVQQNRYSRPESWQPRPESIFTMSDNRTSFEDTESMFPEPLSPRPVVQQTVQRVSMPRPVHASSRQDSLGSTSETSNTYSVREVVVKRPATALSIKSARSSSSVQQRPGLKPVRESAKVLASLSSLAARKPVASDTKSVASATSLEVPEGMIAERTGTETRGSTNSAYIKYTLNRSPLAQNPFNDPSDEEWPLQSDAEERTETESHRPTSEVDDSHDTLQEEPRSKQNERMEKSREGLENDRGEDKGQST